MRTKTSSHNYNVSFSLVNLFRFLIFVLYIEFLGAENLTEFINIDDSVSDVQMDSMQLLKSDLSQSKFYKELQQFP